MTREARSSAEAGRAESIPSLLIDIAWLAQKTVYLESVGPSVVYQVQDGWPRWVLEDAGKIRRINNVHDLEYAMRSPDPAGLYVPASAILTPEIACRIILRHPLGKTIFWETREQ